MKQHAFHALVLLVLTDAWGCLQIFCHASITTTITKSETILRKTENIVDWKEKWTKQESEISTKISAVTLLLDYAYIIIKKWTKWNICRVSLHSKTGFSSVNHVLLEGRRFNRLFLLLILCQSVFISVLEPPCSSSHRIFFLFFVKDLHNSQTK